MKRSTRRQFLQNSLAGGLAIGLSGRGTLAAPFSRSAGANDDIRVAMIGMGGFGGVGGRGRQLIDRLGGVSGVRIAALCDVDKTLLGHEVQKLQKRKQRAKAYTDLRQVFDDKEIDAVFIATPNHWHALATVWACQAGKDVYVEKPVSYTIWEGRQMVEAARKYKRIVQAGTQGRSSDILGHAIEFIQDGQLGKILYAHAINYKRRKSIGKVARPQTIPFSVDYNSWLGPAPSVALMRKELHYDWHWDWSTGNGEMGNNGVHYLDMCRWALGQNGLPRRAMSVGGRFGYDDDGQTPNTQVAILDYESAPIVCEIRGLAEKKNATSMDKFRNVDKGIIIQCEGGSFAGSFLGGTVYDNKGQKIRDFNDRRKFGELAVLHQINFVEAMRSRKDSDLRADILQGHLSAALCHMANTSHRLGTESGPEAMREMTKGNSQWSDASQRVRQHLQSNGIDLEKTRVVLGPWVTMDSDQEKFIDEHSNQANALSRRKYRKPFVVPEIV